VPEGRDSIYRWGGYRAAGHRTYAHCLRRIGILPVVRRRNLGAARVVLARTVLCSVAPAAYLLLPQPLRIRDMILTLGSAENGIRRDSSLWLCANRIKSSEPRDGK
jgi:hypothetical protein